jgi:hypothetical protein
VSSVAALEDWFARRTFHTADLDLDTLIERKRASGQTVSLVLPARNEATTIGGVIAAGRSLLGRLIDELVVVDGASTTVRPSSPRPPERSSIPTARSCRTSVALEARVTRCGGRCG